MKLHKTTKQNIIVIFCMSILMWNISVFNSIRAIEIFVYCLLVINFFLIIYFLIKNKSLLANDETGNSSDPGKG